MKPPEKSVISLPLTLYMFGTFVMFGLNMDGPSPDRNWSIPIQIGVCLFGLLCLAAIYLVLLAATISALQWYWTSRGYGGYSSVAATEVDEEELERMHIACRSPDEEV